MMSKIVTLSTVAVLSFGALAGCTDQVARDMAQDALNKAQAAQACCDGNKEKLDRMYQKIMQK